MICVSDTADTEIVADDFGHGFLLEDRCHSTKIVYVIEDSAFTCLLCLNQQLGEPFYAVQVDEIFGIDEL